VNHEHLRQYRQCDFWILQHGGDRRSRRRIRRGTVGGGAEADDPPGGRGDDRQARGGSGEDYNWKQSIVDLMKLLKLDSSLGARKQLAQELGYKGALDGSAEMNVWLHQQVMTKLAEGGGKVPDNLKVA
jgi:hypothetical protein